MELGHIGSKYLLYLVPFRIDFSISALLITATIALVYLLVLRRRLKKLSSSANKSQQPKIKIKIIETSQSAKPIVGTVESKNKFCSFCGVKMGTDTYYCDRCGGKQ